jgi:co-chaperonin GroES (HSP10)
MFKPLGKNLLIDVLKTEQKGFIEFDREGKEKKTLSYGIVKDKGAECRDLYNLGDKIVFIADQEYMINDTQALLFDEDIIGVENGTR